MKTKIFLTLLLAFGLSSIILSENALAQETDRFNVKVLQYMSEDPAPNVWVLMKQNGITVYTGQTNIAGIASFNAPNGTYDIFAYYPAVPPNDGQSVQKLGHVITQAETLKLQLGPNY